MIEIKNLVREYRLEEDIIRAVDDVTLSFPKTGLISILGPSGCGKTTLLNLIAGLDRFSEGDIIVSGRSTKDFSDKDWDSYRNKHIGYVHQSYNLIGHISIQKNVEMPLVLAGLTTKQRERKAKELLQSVGLLEHKDKKPSEMSGGQKQRVAIARALACDPKVIIADEPTGALDSKSSQKIALMLKDLSKDRLVIMVTHNEQIAREYSDQIVEMLDGKVLSEQSTDEPSHEGLVVPKTKMGFFSAIKLSLSNIKTKKGRTIVATIASSLGIIGLSVAMFLSSGYTAFMADMNAELFSKSPLVFGGNTKITSDNQFFEQAQASTVPSDDYVGTDIATNISENSITMQNKGGKNDEFLEHFFKLDRSLYSYASFFEYEVYSIIGKKANTGEYSRSLCPIKVMPINFSLEEHYELRAGRYPESPDEAILVADGAGNFNMNHCKTIFGIPKDDTYNDWVDKVFSIAKTSDIYKKLDDGRYTHSIDFEKMYTNGFNSKIVGVVAKRPDVSALVPLYKGIYISEKTFTDFRHDCRTNSVAQDVLATDQVILTGTATVSRYSAQLEETRVLCDLGQMTIIPTGDKEKEIIINHIMEFNKTVDNEDKVYFSDPSHTIIDLTNLVWDSVTIALVIFSSIALILSSVMIAIIIHISVIERTKEIGILKSLGAHSKDVALVFSAESVTIGLVSSLIGTVLACILALPINAIVGHFVPGVDTVVVPDVWLSLAMIALGLLLSFLASIIPAMSASKKDPVKALQVD